MNKFNTLLRDMKSKWLAINENKHDPNNTYAPTVWQYYHVPRWWGSINYYHDNTETMHPTLEEDNLR